MTSASIADCIERARDSSTPALWRHAAFEELVRSFEAMAFSSALRLLHDADEARDVAQEAFLAAWLKLDQLRAPAAFGGWLKRLVSTECHRRLRKRPIPIGLHEGDAIPEKSDRRDMDWPLARALAALTEAERRAMVLFYVYGCRIDEIAVMVGAPPATIGKRLYSARLKVRRTVPLAVRADVLRSRTPRRRLESGALEDYVGVYRFERRPELVVEIRRAPRGDFLVSRGNGQRHVLFPIGDDTLTTQSFDGEGRFQRDERGRVTHFIYYEFGARLGLARKLQSPPPVGP